MTFYKDPYFYVLTFLPIVCGSLIGYFTQTGTQSWFKNLKKPSWNPPSWLFGPVWSILYLMMGYASYRIFTATKSLYSCPMILYWLQLLLNFAWTPIFFALHDTILAAFIIVILWKTLIFTIYNFMKYDKIASYLLIPYLLWITFASTLNIYIAVKN